MTKLLIFIATTIGSAIGWWLGAFFGTMTAFVVSMIGTALGLYLGRRYAAQFDM